MEPVDLSPEQLRTIAAWAEPGDDFVDVTVHVERPTFVDRWTCGDALAIQGEATVQVSRGGAVVETVP